MTEQRAKWWRERIELAAQTMPDKDASQSAELFRKLNQSGSLIAAGTRINWNGTVKRAAVDLWDTIENTPETAPTLWEDIEYREGIRIIPKVITVSTAFALNELGWWDDEIYKSLIAVNVYTPEQYPTGWEIQTNNSEVTENVQS